MSTIDPNTSLAQMVLDHPACADVLRNRHLDFCCRGALTLVEACAGKGLDPSEILAALRAATPDEPGRDPREMSTSELVEHIAAHNHPYRRRAVLSIAPMLVKVVRAHATREPRLPLLLDVFRELVTLLESHLEHEETVLYPGLLRASARRIPDARLRAQRDEHLAIGEHVTRIRALADDFVQPDWACPSYRMVMDDLRALEDDIFRHIHLETHVLMPRFGAEPGGVAAAKRPPLTA